MTHSKDVIRRPLLTERSNRQREVENKYSFEVDRRATKTEIRHAIQEAFGVTVTSVHVMHVRGKPRRVRLVEGRKRDWKKAIVTVEKGQTISFFEGV
ncbi:MAG: 50S ribosomal protein L23 [Candidatus Eisenbacteria bacterium]|jgi:large subunit ribosomal protein L23|nr:50S ribosomal protein L23 [Candidatus Eisenbacteria bacterium]